MQKRCLRSRRKPRSMVRDSVDDQQGGSHPRAQQLLHTGYLPGVCGVRYPALGSHVAQRLENPDSELPGFVRVGNVRGSPKAGFLGVKYDPLEMFDASRPPRTRSCPSAKSVMCGDWSYSTACKRALPSKAARAKSSRIEL